MQDSRGIPHFELSGVSRCWGKRIALDNVSFEIKPGELIALVGPSGSGKSTLIRLLGGILRPTSGTVRVDDLDIASFSMRDLRKFRARCGVVGQGLNLVPQLSVHQNVVAGCLPHWPWYKVLASGVIPMRRHRVRHILDTLGIADRQWDATTLLSGGQQQRVAIARALITDPRVILADEPTSSLDPRTAEETTKLIVQRARDAGATLVFCTHWYRIVKPYVTRVLGLRDGKIAFDSLQEDVTEKRLDDLYSGSHERI